MEKRTIVDFLVAYTVKDNYVMVVGVDEQNMNTRQDTFGTLTTDGNSPKHNNRVAEIVNVRQAQKKVTHQYGSGGVADLSYPTSKTRRGRVIDMGNTSPTLTTENIPSVLEPWTWEIDGIKYLIRIRKLTPKECWRLMDFEDDDFEKAEKVNSNTQLYKQAGNSIVVNCLVGILGQLFDGKENIYKERFINGRRNDVSSERED